MYCFIRDHGWDEALVQKHVESLKEKGLVKAMDHGAFTRIIQHEKDIQVRFCKSINLLLLLLL